MCDGTILSSKLDKKWHSFAEAAQEGPHGFGPIPRTPGVYVLRATKVGTVSPSQIVEQYERSRFMKLRTDLDAESEKLFKTFQFGSGWGWQSAAYARKRLTRLQRLDIHDGALACPIVYIGKANKLQRRMIELAWFGHTANDPFWALMHAGWSFEIGIRTVELGSEGEAEAQLKAIYQRHHAGRKPALVER